VKVSGADSGTGTDSAAGAVAVAGSGTAADSVAVSAAGAGSGAVAGSVTVSDSAAGAGSGTVTGAAEQFADGSFLSSCARMTQADKRIIILAGPNGAGKTTFAREYLPGEAGCLTFINADLIAAGLSPFRPEQAAIRAGRLMLEMIEQHVSRHDSFAFETTLAGRGFVHAIPRWRAEGYFVKLYYLSLPSVEIAIGRVKNRIQQGGHSIPEDVLRRRFVTGRTNFDEVYKNLVDIWTLFDNSGPVPISLKKGGTK
jgi:predicted ABC-type ATPase